MSDDLKAIVEWLDPDWKDHFSDVEAAAAFYQEYDPGAWAEAVKEVG